jgi:hypothetical protein
MGTLDEIPFLTMSSINRMFNNQISINEATTYFVTNELKKKIVAQLNGKSVKEQEAIIEVLLKLLDINLLAGLAMAYSAAPPAEKERES